MKLLFRLFSLSFFLFFTCLAHGNEEAQIVFGGDSFKIPFPKEGSIFLPIYSGMKNTISSDSNLEIYILVPEGNKYKQLYVGTIYPEGRRPEIESIFFHNVDDLPGDELFILVSCQILNISSGGKYYTVYIFSKELDEATGGLKRLTLIEEKLGQGLEGVVDTDDGGEGKKVHAPYTNAAGVRRILREKGFLK